MSHSAPPRQGEAAGIVTRGLAATVDVVLVGLGVAAVYLGWIGLLFLGSPTGFSWPTVPWGLLLLIGMALAFCYLTAGWATTGRTYGAALLGLRVLSRSGHHLHWAGAAARAALCTLVPLGLAWVAVSRRRRSLQDIVLGTRVVYDWSHSTAPSQSAPPRPR